MQPELTEVKAKQLKFVKSEEMWLVLHIISFHYILEKNAEENWVAVCSRLPTKNSYLIYDQNLRFSYFIDVTDQNFNMCNMILNPLFQTYLLHSSLLQTDVKDILKVFYGSFLSVMIKK